MWKSIFQTIFYVDYYILQNYYIFFTLCFISIGSTYNPFPAQRFFHFAIQPDFKSNSRIF